MMWYTETCSIMVMDLLYRFDSLVICVCCYSDPKYLNKLRTT
jgi:hypothetical protein